jgi:hypothetical protein
MADELPPMCYHCGGDTERYVYLEAQRQQDNDSPGPFLSLLIALGSLLLLPFTILAWGGPGETQEVSLHLPQCKACAATVGKPRPEFVNLQSDSMTFIVDRRFKQRVLEERRIRSAARRQAHRRR